MTIEYIITRGNTGFYISSYDKGKHKILEFPNRESSIFHSLEEAVKTREILYAQDEIMKDIEKIFGVNDNESN